jgi:hypothetical protein
MTPTGEVSDRNAFLNTSAQLFDNVNGVFIGNNESHIASQVEANRHNVFEQRVLFDNIELQPGRGGITSNLVSTTMLTGEGKIVHLSGRDTAGEFIKQANGDYRRFMQLVRNASVEVQQNIFEQPIGSYTQGPDGVRNLKVNKQDLSDAIYNMKAVTNEFNTLQGAMKMLEKKRVATPQQIMSESSSYSRSYVPQDDFNELDF